jgi:dolichol-phosphate mannosyltransferase
MTQPVSVISPTRNESETLPSLIAGLHTVLRGHDHQVIIVDDSSSDGTYELASRLADIVIVKKRSEAPVAGIEKAKYPVVVTIDADLENDPSNIPRLLLELENGYDLVVATRPRLPRFSERLFSATIGKQIGVTDVLSGFRAMRKDRVAAIRVGKHETFGAEFLIRAYKQGLLVSELEIKETPRRSQSRLGGPLRANLRILKALFVCFTIWFNS